MSPTKACRNSISQTSIFFLQLKFHSTSQIPILPTTYFFFSKMMNNLSNDTHNDISPIHDRSIYHVKIGVFCTIPPTFLTEEANQFIVNITFHQSHSIYISYNQNVIKKSKTRKSTVLIIYSMLGRDEKSACQDTLHYTPFLYTYWKIHLYKAHLYS